jgi:hypothetical protein
MSPTVVIGASPARQPKEDPALEVRVAEARLRAAMLASDVDELDALIDDALLFVGPDGAVYSKSDDLELHRSGMERLSRVDVEIARVTIHGDTAVVVVDAELTGVMRGEPFHGRYRYVRTWRRGPTGWRVIAGTVIAASE